MLTYINEYIGCRDCSIVVSYCKKCTNKSVCNECRDKYILNNNKCINT